MAPVLEDNMIIDVSSEFEKYYLKVILKYNCL